VIVLKNIFFYIFKQFAFDEWINEFSGVNFAFPVKKNSLKIPRKAKPEMHQRTVIASINFPKPNDVKRHTHFL
jgi:hypothetical protein